jgi:hypothetical protein
MLALSARSTSLVFHTCCEGAYFAVEPVKNLYNTFMHSILFQKRNFGMLKNILMGEIECRVDFLLIIFFKVIARLPSPQ